MNPCDTCTYVIYAGTIIVELYEDLNQWNSAQDTEIRSPFIGQSRHSCWFFIDFNASFLKMLHFIIRVSSVGDETPNVGYFMVYYLQVG